MQHGLTLLGQHQRNLSEAKASGLNSIGVYIVLASLLNPSYVFTRILVRSRYTVLVEANALPSSNSAPDLVTEPGLANILAELIAREPIFHRPEFGTARSDFEKATVADFWEVGASGRRYSRKYVLDLLEERYSVAHADIWEAKNFHCRRLGSDTFLLTYTLIQDHQRVTRRSTIWQSTADGWKIVFHQGTIVEDIPTSSPR